MWNWAPKFLGKKRCQIGQKKKVRNRIPAVPLSYVQENCKILEKLNFPQNTSQIYRKNLYFARKKRIELKILQKNRLKVIFSQNITTKKILNS